MACSSQGLAGPCVPAVDQAPAAQVLYNKRPGIPAVLYCYRRPSPQACIWFSHHIRLLSGCLGCRTGSRQVSGYAFLTECACPVRWRRPSL